MSRRVFVLILAATLLGEGAVFAQSTAPARRSHTTRRIVWTLIGAGAGFSAGVFIGLNKFDDSIDSDRKVWTSAIVGAVAGGLAGGLLSGSRKQEPPGTSTEPARFSVLRTYPRTLAHVASPQPLWQIPRLSDAPH